MPFQLTYDGHTYDIIAPGLVSALETELATRSRLGARLTAGGRVLAVRQLEGWFVSAPPVQS